MPLYETLFIIHPDQATKAKEWVDRYRRVVEESEGTVSHVEEWGLKEMAYRIRKQKRGYYVLFQYLSPPRGVEELERQMKLSDGIIRYMTVRLDEETPPKAPSGGGKTEDKKEEAKKPAQEP